MPILLSWYDDVQTILFYQFQGHWNWQEFHHMMQVGRDRMAEKKHMVDFIVDLSENRQWMTGVLGEVKKMFSQSPPNSGKIAVINADPLSRMMYSVLKKVEHRLPNKLDVCFVENCDEGYKWLLAQRNA